MPENNGAKETQITIELSSLRKAVGIARDKFSDLRTDIVPILRSEPQPPSAGQDETEQTVPRAQEIQSIRHSVEALVAEISGVISLNEA